MLVNMHVGQDNFDISQIDVSLFNIYKGDIKYIKSIGKEVFDFVGIILSDKRNLVVFPKHFYSENQLEVMNNAGNVNQRDVKLLFDVMMKYMDSSKTKAKANRHFGFEPEFKSDYPFAPFFAIYKYYQHFGVYRENTMEIKPNISGDIAWKQTIQKSNVIISEGNILYSPLYKKRKRTYNVFLSECMVFVINHTIKSFPLFINLPVINSYRTTFDFLKYRDYTINQLRLLRNRIFKDADKSLVDNLIDFFEQYSKSSQGGEVHIKINYFDRIWEEMVEIYLNDYFQGVDEINNKLIFNKSFNASRITFTSKEFEVDVSPHKFKIRLDHFAKSNDAIFIFDSKYYYKVNDMNYKQFSYNELLRGKFEGDKHIYSALILPGDVSNSSLHFFLSPHYRGNRTKGLKIIEHYLNVQEVMMHYVSS
ncbi:LlaJI family restriction endonuclease [Listeria monocytogenes]|nr:LlaJI family restriction endonuclease [Listeria monocytogenes]